MNNKTPLPQGKRDPDPQTKDDIVVTISYLLAIKQQINQFPLFDAPPHPKDTIPLLLLLLHLFYLVDNYIVISKFTHAPLHSKYNHHYLHTPITHTSNLILISIHLHGDSLSLTHSLSLCISISMTYGNLRSLFHFIRYLMVGIHSTFMLLIL